MKTAKLILLALAATTLTMAGCARHHGYGMGSEHQEAMLERGVAETNEMVDQTVKDPEKAKQVKAIVQDIVAEVKQSYKQNREYHQKLYALNANYEATPEQFTKILDDLNNARMASATKILGLRFKMKSLLTAQEWADLTSAMDKARSRHMPKPEGM
jgi:Spy/CpxP family protein refolding chaperone